LAITHWDDQSNQLANMVQFELSTQLRYSYRIKTLCIRLKSIENMTDMCLERSSPTKFLLENLQEIRNKDTTQFVNFIITLMSCCIFSQFTCVLWPSCSSQTIPHVSSIHTQNPDKDWFQSWKYVTGHRYSCLLCHWTFLKCFQIYILVLGIWAMMLVNP
jgi:hypothetical protein